MSKINAVLIVAVVIMSICMMAIGAELSKLPSLYVSAFESEMGTYGPRLKPLPDIFIGDMEDNFGTYDFNFFRFCDALDLDMYVKDLDTPDSDLIWSFWEGGSGALKINGITELADPADALIADLLGKDIRHPADPQYQPGNYIDLWDIKDSPEELGPPWPAPVEPLDEIVTFFVSDGTLVDSVQVRIKAVDDEYDSLEGWENIGDYDFDGTTEGWTFHPLSGNTPDASFTGAFSAYDGYRLGITTDDTTNRYAYWAAPAAVPYQANKLYRLQWELSTDQTDPKAVPIIRFRVNSSALGYAAEMVLTSTDNALIQPPVIPATKKYNQYVMSPFTDSSDLLLSFDVYDFDVTERGTVYLESLAIWTTEVPDSGWTPVTMPALNTWTFGGWIPPFSPAGTGTIGGLQLMSSVPADYTFGFWQSPYSLPWILGQLYRAEFVIVSSDVDPPNGRVRVNSKDYMVGYNLRYYGPVAPNEVGRSYVIYFETPPYFFPNFGLAFDITDFENDRGGTITLTDVTVERHPLIP